MLQVRSLSRSSEWCSTRHKRMCCTHVQTWVTVCHWLKICLLACLVIHSSMTSAWAFHRRLSLPHLQPHQPRRSRCRSMNTATIHKMRTWLCRQNNLFYRLWAQAARQLRILRDLYSDLPEWIRRHRHGTVVLVRCGTRRWAYQKSAIFTNCSLRSEKNLRTWWRKFVTSSVLSHTNKYGKPVYEPSSNLSQKRKSSRDLENEQIRILLERQKEQILAEVRSEIQKHELQPDSERRSILELTGIISDSQRMEIDHTITGCEQSRRDQLLFQE